jgi:hypothetical protein
LCTQETLEEIFPEEPEERSRIVAGWVMGRDMEQERRRNPRYPFKASIEMREGTSEDKRTARVTGLSLNGCYVNTENPYPEGTSLKVKVFTEADFYEGQATVIYTQENLGMGLMFTETKPYYLMVLRKWLLSAMMEKKANPA